MKNTVITASVVRGSGNGASDSIVPTPARISAPAVAGEADVPVADDGAGLAAGAPLRRPGAVPLVAAGREEEDETQQRFHAPQDRRPWLTRNGFLVVLNIALVAGACSDGNDLQSAGSVRTVGEPARIPPLPAVEKADGAIIQSGMRSGAAPPEQQPGEVVVSRWNWTMDEPWYPNGNYPSNVMTLITNGRWPNLLSPEASWYSGHYMAQTIKDARFWVPAGYCVGFKAYAEVNYGSPYTFLGNWVCRPSWMGGVENWMLWNNAWQIRSMKTAMVPCGPGNCAPPADF